MSRPPDETSESNPSNIRSLSDARSRRRERNEATLEKLRTGTLSTVREPYHNMRPPPGAGPTTTRADLAILTRAIQECQDQVVRLTTSLHDIGVALAETQRIQSLLVTHLTVRRLTPDVPD